MQTNTLAALGAVLALSAVSTLATPLGPAFNYQGRLSDGTNVANGSYDLKFSLYDALTIGGQVGNSLTNPATGVTNGLFTISLDFGSSAFNGNARWLLVEVRTNGGGAFMPLSPRQAVLATPYAWYATNAGTAITLSGVLPSASLAGPYSQALTLNNAANQLSGNGSGLTSLNASQLTSGTVPDGRLSANVALRSGGNAFTGNQTVTSGNVGIGNTTPAQPLHVTGSAQFDKNDGRLVLRTPARNDPGRYGIQFSNNILGLFLGDDTQEQQFGFYSGWSANRTNDASIVVFGKATGSWGNYLKLTHDGTNGSVATDAGHLLLAPAQNVGLGTNNPQAKLHVAGSVLIDGPLTVLNWATKTGYVAVAAAAFQPARSGLTYTNTGAYLTALYVNSQFYAPAQLPNGATVTRLTWAGVNPIEAASGQLKLYRCNLAGTINEMASVDSTSGGGEQSDTTISNATVDNSLYQYYLRMELSGAFGYSAIIRYTYSQP